VIDIKKFDKEYSTQYPLEVKFLKENNIEYSFVKVINGITVYKYTKNKKLFDVLSMFYESNGE
jgi:hypothetical protein